MKLGSVIVTCRHSAARQRVATDVRIQPSSQGSFDRRPAFRMNVQASHITRSFDPDVAAGSQLGNDLHAQEEDQLQFGNRQEIFTANLDDQSEIKEEK